MKFVVVMVGVLGGGLVYLGWRLAVISRWPAWAKLLCWLGLLLQVGLITSLPLGWWGRWQPPPELYPLWAWCTFVAMGLFLFLGLTTVLRDLLWLVSWLWGRLWRGSRGGWRGGHERRAAWIHWTLFLLLPLVLGYSVLEARRTPRVERVSLPLPELVPELVDFRWALVSDLHVGHTIGRTFVERVVQRVNSLQPDAVAITGDLIDGSVERLGPAVAPLADLQAPQGVFYVPGNHEYYSGELRGWLTELGRLGVTPLMNEHRVLHRGPASLVVAGVTDHRAGAYLEGHQSDPAKALAGAPEGALRLMLAHQPQSARAAAAQGAQIQLSGHTHGGQIFPFHLLAWLTQPVLAGRHRYGGMWLYVSRGTGYWGPPFRWLAPAEITILRLTTR